MFPIRFESTTAIANALASVVSYGLPDDYFDTYRSKIRSVTADHVLETARAHLRPDELQIVAVGDPAVVREPLEQLKVGRVLTYDAEGRPGRNSRWSAPNAYVNAARGGCSPPRASSHACQTGATVTDSSRVSTRRYTPGVYSTSRLTRFDFPTGASASSR